jgi:hypothetical protein
MDVNIFSVNVLRLQSRAEKELLRIKWKRYGRGKKKKKTEKIGQHLQH